MNLQLTNAGVAALIANAGPVPLQSFQLGTAFNYIPINTDTGLHGTSLWSGTVSPFNVVSANLVKYSVYLDYSVGPFNFGEIGLYFVIAGVPTLFALGSSDTLIPKLATGITAGNSIRIDLYLSMVGQNYSMFLDLAESNNDFRMATLESVDYLPSSQHAIPNVYIIKGATSSQSAVMAYTDRNALWNFDVYQFGNNQDCTIVSATASAITIAFNQAVINLNPSYFGEIIIEFLSGACYSTCRNVLNLVSTSTSVVLNFVTPLAIIPSVGDTFRIYSRQAIATTDVILPIATINQLGVVIVGPTLTVDNTGILNTKPVFIPVTSVNSKTGDVLLKATDIAGFATVATSGSYTDLLNTPNNYTLPIATQTVLGGIKAPTTGNINITNQGVLDLTFNPVKSVNTNVPDANGDVTITFPTPPAVVGLVNPTVIANNTDLNTLTTTGLFYNLTANTLANSPQLNVSATLEVITLTGDTKSVMQRWSSTTGVYCRTLTNSIWNSWYSVLAGNIVNEYFFANINFTPSVTTALLLNNNYGSSNNVSVHFDGGFQGPDTYTVNNLVLTFTSAIPMGVEKVFVRGGTSLPIGVPSDKTITVAKLAVDTLAYFAPINRVNIYTANQSIATISTASSGNITSNAALTNNFKTTLTGNGVLVNPTNLTDGMQLLFRIKQDSTGNRLLTYGSFFKFFNGVVPTLSTSANAVDILTCYYDAADNVLDCKLNNNYS